MYFNHCMVKAFEKPSMVKRPYLCSFNIHDLCMLHPICEIAQFTNLGQESIDHFIKNNWQVSCTHTQKLMEKLLKWPILFCYFKVSTTSYTCTCTYQNDTLLCKIS